MEENGGGAVQPDEGHRQRPAQSDAIVVNITDGVTYELSGALDFHLFGELVEAALAESAGR